MAKMLRKKATKFYGCCDACHSGQALPLKPGPRERHQARAVEKRQWTREKDDEQ